MVATVAFGMGINHNKVKAVIHLNMPNTLEQYYQEAGRAGRDKNMKAKCILYYDYSDKILADLRNSLPGNSTLKILAYCEDIFTCRRILIAQHFGETVNISQCGICDNCTYNRKSSIKLIDFTLQASIVVDFVAALPIYNLTLTLNQLNDALRGLSIPKKPEIAKVPGFGTLKTCTLRFLRFLIINQWLEDHVKQIGRGIFGYVAVGPKAKSTYSLNFPIEH
ncbi:putative helicase [Perkinsus sp. BL_2016]|nr:putative helicase [Perkinsus sp. BL_2016]